MTKGAKPVAALWSRAYLLLTMTALFWAGNSIVGHAARELVPPAALSFWRWAIALSLLLPLAWPHLKRDWPVLRANWPILLLFGTLGIGAFNTLLYAGLQTTTALNSMMLQSAQPALILMVGALVMHDRTSARQVAGVLVSLAGVLAIISRGDIGALFGLDLNAGDAIIGVAVVLWAIYSVFLRRRPAVHPLSLLAASIAIGVVAISPVYAVELWSGRRIVPVWESGLAMLFLGESLYPFHVVGLTLVVAGIVLAGRGAPPPPASGGSR